MSAGILQLFVHPEYERQGYGTRLMSDICEAMNKRKAHCFAFAPRDALGFYSQFGFTPSVNFRVLNGNHSGGVVGMVRKPLQQQQIPSALADPAVRKALEKALDWVGLHLTARVALQQSLGEPFSSAEIEKVIEITGNILAHQETLEGIRAKADDAVETAFKRVGIMRMLRRPGGPLEAQRDEAEEFPGAADASNNIMEMVEEWKGRFREVKVKVKGKAKESNGNGAAPGKGGSTPGNGSTKAEGSGSVGDSGEGKPKAGKPSKGKESNGDKGDTPGKGEPTGTKAEGSGSVDDKSGGGNPWGGEPGKGRKRRKRG